MSPIGTRRARDGSGICLPVTNAFRQRVHLGRELTQDERVRIAQVTNAFRQRVHLGLKPDGEQDGPEPQVTNAFRQRVHLGLNEAVGIVRSAIKSPMPFGNESTWDTMGNASPCLYHGVTNAFRQRVHLGHAHMELHELLIKHMSPMPFGNESTWD